MMEHSDLVARINILAKKKREEGLTKEEQAEQKELYEIYLSRIRQSAKAHVESITVQYEDGSRVKMADLKKRKE